MFITAQELENLGKFNSGYLTSLDDAALQTHHMPMTQVRLLQMSLGTWVLCKVMEDSENLHQGAFPLGQDKR